MAKTSINIKVPEENESPKIVAICGSSRYIDAIAISAWLIERDENAIVLSMHCLPSWYFLENDTNLMDERENLAEILIDRHQKKIDMADELFVVNCRDYIGKDSEKLIEYAIKKGIKIRWFKDDIIGARVNKIGSDAVDIRIENHREEQDKQQGKKSKFFKKNHNRNKPCPCSSGKKFKKCCFLKQQRLVTKLSDERDKLEKYRENLP